MGEKIFQAFDILIMVFTIAVVVLPFMHIISISVSDRVAVNTLQVGIFPVGFQTGAYYEIISNPIFTRSLFNTVFTTVITTALSVFVITMCAYALAKPYFYGKKVITYFFILPMYFSGGLIPTYLLITNYLHLNNNYLAYILPAIVNVFYLIVVKGQIEAAPVELIEAANIDGASEWQTLIRVVLPIIGPTIAAVSMFIALNTWNMWYPVLLYARDDSMWSLQYFLRAVVFDKFFSSYSDSVTITSGSESIPPQNFQMAAIILVALPIVAIYPFVQKYFVKGILAGSVKG